jgi:stress-induced morphogen
MGVGEIILTVRLKNRTQIKNHKNKHELRLIRPEAQHRSPEHMNLKFLTASTPICGENCESSLWVQVSCCKFTNLQQIKKHKCTI